MYKNVCELGTMWLRAEHSNQILPHQKKTPNNFNRMQLASWMPFLTTFLALQELLALNVCLCKGHGNNCVQSGLEVVLMGT